MRYLLLVLTEPIDAPVAEELDIEAWVTKHDASGARVWGDRLADAAEARTIRVRASGETIEDGPFQDAHLAIAGLDILECGSLEEAVQIGLEHPMARGGVIEIRPFYDWDAEGA